MSHIRINKMKASYEGAPDRYVDFYYDSHGNNTRSITSDGHEVTKQFDNNGKLIYIESSDNDIIMCSKQHFNIVRIDDQENKED